MGEGKKDELMEAVMSLSHVSQRMLKLAQAFSGEEEWFDQFEVLLQEREGLLKKLTGGQEVLIGEFSSEIRGLIREIENMAEEITAHLNRQRDNLKERLRELNRSKTGLKAYVMPEAEVGPWFIDRKE